MPEEQSELYRLINVSGTDAAAFLQGQLTQDVSLLSAAGSIPAAWCNPQGRVIVTMRLVALGGAIGLIVPAGIALDVCNRLARYKLRADVEISTAGTDWHCIATSATPATNSQHVVVNVYRTNPPLTEICGPADAVAEFSGALDLTVDQWSKRLIHAGVPVIDAANSEQFTPHMLNLDRLGAVSFSKGCYTGQEIVARTQHLGASKRRLMRYRCDSGSPAIGDKLQHEGANVGEVVNVSGKDLLAVTPVALHAEILQAGGAAAKPVGLPY